MVQKKNTKPPFWIALLGFLLLSLPSHTLAESLFSKPDPLNEINVLSWNVADMYYPGDTSEMGKSREARVNHIVELLKERSTEWQVVLLQEVWTKQGLEKLQTLKEQYPYIVDTDTRKIDIEDVFKNAWKFLSIKWAVDNEKQIPPVLDRGLTILSQLPVLDLKTLTYSKNGTPKYARYDGEMLAGKGAIAVLLYDEFLDKKFWVVNTHLVANYQNNPKHPESYGEQREQQLIELESWIQDLNQDDLPVILAGDFNVGPNHDTTPSIWQKIPALLKQFLIPEDEATQPRTTHNCGQIDHVFGTENVIVQTKDAIPARELKISDHDAVLGRVLFL